MIPVRFRSWYVPVLAAAVLVVGGYLAYVEIERRLKNQLAEELTAILNADVTALGLWIDSQKKTAEVQAGEPTVRSCVMDLVGLAQNPDCTPQSLLKSESLTRLRQYLLPICQAYGYIGFVVTDHRGINVAALFDDPLGRRSLADRGDFIPRALAGETLMTKPFPAEIALPDEQGVFRNGRPTMFVATPVYDDRGQPVAVLSFRIRPELSFTQILTVARYGETGETYAFDSQGLMLSDSRFNHHLRTVGLLPNRSDAQAILNVHLRDPGGNLVAGFEPSTPRETQPLTRMAAFATTGRSGCDVRGYRDYRGVPVVGAWTWLGEHGFGVATEVDVDEVMRPIWYVRGVFFAVLSMLAVATGVLLFVERGHRKKARALRASEAYTRTIVNNAADAIVVISEGGLIETFNPAAEQMFGYGADEVVGQNISMLMPSPYREEHDGHIARYLRTGHTAVLGRRRELVGQRKDGSVFPLALASTEVWLGPRRLFMGVMRDISQQKAIESQLRESEQRYELAIRGTSEAIWDWDVRTGQVFYSLRYQELLGCEEGDLPSVFDSFESRLHEWDRERVAGAIQDHLSKGSPCDVECRLRTAHQGFRWFRLRGQAVWDGSGQAVRMAGSLGDITKQKEVEDHLRSFTGELVEVRQQLESQNVELATKAAELSAAREAAEVANRTKSDFLANMSHEIRTPMTAILGFADLLLDANQTAQEREHCVQTIRRNADHLLTIINDILDISKIEAGKLGVELVRCSPRQIVVETMTLIGVRADAKNLSLNAEYIGPIPESIQTDPTRLRQILINLLGNAIKFTETGGVRLVVRFVCRQGASPVMQFDVVDSGVGMTQEEVAKLFQPFTQADTSTARRFGGTGLGLTISKRLAQMLGGDLVLLETQRDLGTRFRATVATGNMDGVAMVEVDQAIPPRAERPDRPAAPADPPGLHGCRVLLAEDGLDNQRLIARVLSKAGAQVTIAGNGQFAFELAMESLEQGDPFDVILMDMQMPVMDGYEATRLLRRFGYTRPIVALTAHAMASDRDKCIQAGCDDYTTKPIDRSKLLEAVGQFLNSVSRVR
jgi:PAS domain S-box-containing protein